VAEISADYGTIQIEANARVQLALWEPRHCDSSEDAVLVVRQCVIDVVDANADGVVAREVKEGRGVMARAM
jgi:hypothetical protein